MVQGDAYSIDITIKNLGEAIPIDTVEKVEVTLLNLTRSYPEEVTYSDGKIPLPRSPRRRPSSFPRCAPCRSG